MAKEKEKPKKKSGKRVKEEEAEEFQLPISTEAVRGVVAVLTVAVGIFLALSAFGIGGWVGALLYQYLSLLLGVGYMLLPVSLILLAAALMRSFENKLGALQSASILVFFISALGLVGLALPEQAGVVGNSIAQPLIAGVGLAATAIFLTAFILAALIVAFDIHIGALIQALRERMRAQTDAMVAAEDSDERLAIAGMDDADDDTDEIPGDEYRDMPDEGDEPEPSNAPARDREVDPKQVHYADAANKEVASGFPIMAARDSVYNPPPMSILAKNKGKAEVGDVKANANIIKRTLQNFGIQVEMDEVSIGPTVTRYAMKPAEGVRLSKIVALQSNLELALSASPVRIEAPIPGKALVGIEVPNLARSTIGLAPMFADPGFSQSDKPLVVALGRSITGVAHFTNLARMPHLLVAGTTGSGKSVTIHNFIVSLLYRVGPERLRFIMIDPKRVELTLYNDIPHLLTPVITDAKKAILALRWLTKEMDRRYSILETEKVRDIASYHENVVAPALERGGTEGAAMPDAMPYIVVFIDELADIMQLYPRELEASIVRLAQMSRAVGIHLVLSTQRPDAKVITGLIKANIPSRVALKVNSQIESRIIIDQGGAEKLLGAGDLLFLSNDSSKPTRVQSAYISEDEVKKIVNAVIRDNDPAPLSSNLDLSDKPGAQSDPNAIFSAMEDEAQDPMYDDAKRTVMEAGKASTSYLQRKLGVGYSRAAKLMDLLEQKGVIGPADGAKPREVYGASPAAYDSDTEESEEMRV